MSTSASNNGRDAPWDTLARAVPAAGWLARYDRADLRGDLMTGLTVGVLLVPQSMAYAVLAGLPPTYGLYAALVPLVVYALLGTSRHLAIGPIAIDMLIVAAGLGALAEPMTEAYVQLALLLAAMVGALQLAMSAARLGFLVNLLSRPVITGFTSAAALIIAFSQLGGLLGLDLPQSQHVYTLVWEAVQQAGQVQSGPAAVGLVSIALLVGLSWWKPLFPAPLFVIGLATLATWELGLGGLGVETVGAVPGGLPRPALPAFGLTDARAPIPTALTLGLVQFMTVMSLGKTFGARHGYSINPNRELWAIGAANLVGSLFRAIPVSSSFSRSAMGEQTGVRTPLAGVVAAALVALTLLLLTPVFAYLPVPALAALIMVAAYGLFDWRALRGLLALKRTDGRVALFTFAATLLLGIQEGLLLGIGASVVAIMYRISRPHVAELGHLPGTRSFRDVRANARARRIEELMLLRVDASFSFANAEFLKDLILDQTLPDKPPLEAIIIDATSINDLDTTAVQVLQSVAETLEARGVRLYFGGVKAPVMEVMRRAGLHEQLGADRFFLSPHRAVKHVLSGRDTALELEGYTETIPGEGAD